jgi:ubiquinone/menaquinone biosynthesis C-methylase UbiE
MKIEFQETTNDLLKRIDIHSQYGARDIDSWMLEILQLQKGLRILDVGCGAGKQCFSFFQHLSGEAEITGTDVSESLLAQARQENEKRGADVRFQLLDFNKPSTCRKIISIKFPVLLALLRAILPFICRMHRVLKTWRKTFHNRTKPPTRRSFMTSSGSPRKTQPTMPAARVMPQNL